MQRDVFFLRDIVESIDAMELFWGGRDRATHAYLSTDWSMVYEIASVQALELRGQVQAIIDQPESASRPAQEGDS